MSKNILVIAIDYDGCTSDRDYERLIESFKNKIKLEGAAEVVLVNFSSRQDASVNYINMMRNQNGCCFDHLDVLHKKLQNDLPTVTINLCKFTMTDILNNKAIGKSFDEAISVSKLPQNQQLNEIISNGISADDEYKILLTYSISQYVMQQYADLKQGDTVSMYCLDDRDDILSILNDIFTNSPSLLNQNLTLTLVHYTMENKQQPSFSKIDKNLEKIKGTNESLIGCKIITEHNLSKSIYARKLNTSHNDLKLLYNRKNNGEYKKQYSDEINRVAKLISDLQEKHIDKQKVAEMIEFITASNEMLKSAESKIIAKILNQKLQQFSCSQLLRLQADLIDKKDIDSNFSEVLLGCIIDNIIIKTDSGSDKSVPKSRFFEFNVTQKTDPITDLVN